MSEAYKSFFSGKKITVMGLGILGRGVGDVEFLASQGADLIVTDLKKSEDLSTSLDQLKKFKNIKFTLGEHKLEDFRGRDMIIKAAGVPLDSPYINEAKANNVPVYMSTALFAHLSGAVIVGITGTRGKSTVTQFIYEGLKAAGKSVHLGGNIRGKSTLAMLPEVKKTDIAVLELDSWQLQGFRDLKISPHVAVFTNLMPDHMNYYKDDMDLYFNDKAAIFENQKPEDFLIAGADIAKKIHAKSKMIIPQGMPDDWKLKIPGAHNRLNAACALEALRVLGVKDGTSRKAFESFSGLEGRLNLLREIDGVKIYNDSNATTPEAAMAAMNAFESGKILLIAGGADKNLDIGEMVRAMKESCREMAFLSGTGTLRLSAFFPDAPVFDNLEKAFYHVMNLAKAGDVVVLSPGFASFGMFRNEYDRGDQFENLVRTYKSSFKAANV